MTRDAAASERVVANIATALTTRTALRDIRQLSLVVEDAILRLAQEVESANTLRSYRTALRYWAAWFWLRYGTPIQFPVDVASVLQFVNDHTKRWIASEAFLDLPPALDMALVQAGVKAAPGPPALATVLHRVSVLSKAHRSRSLENPCENSKVRDLLAKMRTSNENRAVDAASTEPWTQISDRVSIWVTHAS